MTERYQASWGERGCLIFLWILSPLAAAYVWFFFKILLWIFTSTDVYLLSQSEGAPVSFYHRAFEWGHWWWFFLIAAITIPFLLLVYLWVILSTGRILIDRWKRR
jgi:hypothetical protein